MPIEAYPEDAKAQFDYLVGKAEGYVMRGYVGHRAFRIWRNRALAWLKGNAPTSQLQDTLVTIPTEYSACLESTFKRPGNCSIPARIFKFPSSKAAKYQKSIHSSWPRRCVEKHCSTPRI